MLNKRNIALSIIAVSVFAVCLWLAVSGKYNATEMQLHYALQFKSVAFYWMMRAFSFAGDTIRVIIICALFLAITRCDKRYSVPSVASVIIGCGLNNLIKVIVCRARPVIENCELNENTYSFPSGHAMSNISLYAALAFCIMLYCKRAVLKKILVPILIAVPVMMGISRIYFGVHYPTDIVAGWSLGLLSAYWVVKLYDKYIFKKIKFLKIGEKSDGLQ